MCRVHRRRHRRILRGALILTRFPELKFATCSWFAHRILNSLVIEQGGEMKFLIVSAMSLGVLNAAVAADLPHPQPPPPQPIIGKAPIGKMPIGKYPIGKSPAPVVTKG
jgi:hypothetical protein